MQQERTIGSMAQEKQGLTAKDFVFIAVFGILLFAVFMAISLLFGLNANIMWFSHTAGAIPGGIVWTYLLYRVPKRGTIAIMGVLVGLIGLLMGMFWSGAVGLAIGGVLAELVAGTPAKRTPLKTSAAFAVFIFAFWLGQIMLILMSGQAYVEMCVEAGLTEEYGQTLVNFVYSPLGIVAGITTVIGSLLGGLLGSRVFARHFAKMGA